MFNIRCLQKKILIKGLFFMFFIVTSSLLIGGCGPINFKAGERFDSGQLESVLKTGDSDHTQIKAVLGDPFGTGRALMPFHDKPRTVWTYYFEKGSIDLGGGESTDNRKYLFIFLDDDIYDGYIWFDSILN